MAYVGQLFTSPQAGPLLLAVGAVGLYVAGRLGAEVVDSGATAPGRRAWAHFLPVVWVTLAATFIGDSALAIGVLFASAVTSLSLVLGLCLLTRPDTAAPPRWRRTWPYILPASLLAWVIGFRGEFSLWHAAALLLQGGAILLSWRGCVGEEAADPPMNRRQRHGLAAAIVIGLVGAAAMVVGTQRFTQQTRVFNGGLLAAVVAGPALMLPMIGAGMKQAAAGRTWVATTTAVGVTLLNLGLLLPLVIAVWHVAAPADGAGLRERLLARPAAQAPPAATSAPAADDKDTEPVTTRLAYPLVVWRLDTVMLVVLGLMLLPPALGWWNLGRAAGLVLVVGYTIYLLLAGILGTWG